MPPSKKNNKNNSMTKYHQPQIWQRELKRPPSEAVESASIRMKETCDDPSGFCDLLISDACQCPHLARWLPNMLDLNHVFCKTTSGSRPSSLVLADPVHALHMSSQMEENSTLQETFPSSMRTSPWLYGEEQQRTVAFSQAGVASGFFPLTTDHIFHQFNAPNPDAPKPLHASPPSPSKNSKGSPSKLISPTKPGTPTKSISPTKKDSPSTRSPSRSPSSKTAEPVTKKAELDASPVKHSASVSFASPVASVKEIEETKSGDAEEGGDDKEEGTEDKLKDAKMKDAYNKKEKTTADSEDSTNDPDGEDRKEESDRKQGKEDSATKDVDMTDAELVDRKKDDGNTNMDFVGEKESDSVDATMRDAGAKAEVGEADDKTDTGQAEEEKKKEDENEKNDSSKTKKEDDKEDAGKNQEQEESKEGQNTDQIGEETVKDGKGEDDSGAKEGDISTERDSKLGDDKPGGSDANKGSNDKDETAEGDSQDAGNDASQEASESVDNNSKPSKDEENADKAAKKEGDNEEAEASNKAQIPDDPEGKEDTEKGILSATRSPDSKDKNMSATPSSPSTAAAGVSSSTKVAMMSPTAKPKLSLSDARFLEISRNEEQIKVIRKLLAKRIANTKRPAKKRKLESRISQQHNVLQSLPGSLQYKEERPIIEIDKKERENWFKEKAMANRQVEIWLEQFRSSRRTYWKEQTKIKQDRSTSSKPKSSIHFSEWSTTETWQRTCQLCPISKHTFVGDEIMQCLECSFIGCSPVSISPRSRNQHILQHLLLSGHKLAVTCGARADIFCFPCGDFVFHKLFDQERERLDLEAQIPWLAWSDHPLQRSFDPLQFAQVEEYGILWRGLMATYPPLVPQEHIDASRFCLVRQAVFEGRVRESDWVVMGRRALDFVIHQNKTEQDERYKIPYPIGMYNLGNTCFMSSILQCLVHCPPFQRYFLKDIGHHHKACEKYRQMSPIDKAKDAADNVCLACEMDSLMLEYYSRSTGRNVVGILNDLTAAPRRSIMDLLNEISSKDEETIERGEPMIISRMLHVAWKSSGMGHLAGYEQRDAHEFLHAFLDILGKQICKYRARVDAAIALARAGSRFKKEQEPVHHDVIKHLFEGKLRSVLVCQDCGTKRTLSEVFLNISLPLLKELVASHTTPGGHVAGKLSLDRCLQHFTSPETLADPVDCPACRKKTTTKKQHTFSKLPRVLCVHFKRFHAALNKKIEDFVSFPARGLNMGPHLPHWREVTTVPDKASSENPHGAEPEILYDLFGTVNHHGNLQSGHYTTNVRIGQDWFRCNDQHVSKSTEATVLTNDGAYILFYRRR